MGLENPIRILAGQYYDQETSLHYNYHRYYDPATGRYLTADPIGLEGGINVFAYANNNPVNFVDPWGLEGIGIAYGGAISFPGFRFSTHFELRLVHNSTESLSNLSSWSFAFTNTTTYANNYDDNPCNDANVYGAEIDLGPDIMVTNADHISQILGYSINGGASAGWGFGGDFEISGILSENEGLTFANGTPVFENAWFLPLYGQNYGLEVHEHVRENTVPIFLVE